MYSLFSDFFSGVNEARALFKIRHPERSAAGAQSKDLLSRPSWPHPLR
jgi:hypothetical protein